MIVYLSGGMRSGWQARVRFALPGVRVADPSQHRLESSADFTAADLHGLRLCSVVLGYIERDNASPMGLAAELGYAKALGKQIVLASELLDARHLRFVHQLADVLVGDIDEAVAVVRCMWRMIGE